MHPIVKLKSFFFVIEDTICLSLRYLCLKQTCLFFIKRYQFLCHQNHQILLSLCFKNEYRPTLYIKLPVINDYLWCQTEKLALE